MDSEITIKRFDFSADLAERKEQRERLDAWLDANAPRAGEKASTSGVMLALFPSLAVAKDLAVPGGEDPYDMHVTLAYLGKADALLPGQAETLRRIGAAFAAEFPPLEAQVGGLGKFIGTEEDGDPVVLLIDAPELPAMREALVRELVAAGLPVATDHGFTPHMTLRYVPHGEVVTDGMMAQPPIIFDALHVCIGEDRNAYLFGTNV